MMNQTPYQGQSNDIRIQVWPFFVPEQSSAQKQLYFYAYKVEIENLGQHKVQLISRHWIIRDGHGHQEQVKGEGVVGQSPILRPGESFTYTSFCPLKTPTGNMRGRYEMALLDEEGNSCDYFWADIPLFFFRPPVLRQ